jgi:HAD superfamily hydrolase (TIGR01509 family)
MKAIIFDFDGTILDTEFTELAAWQSIYSEYNHTLPLEEWSKRVGSHVENFNPLLHLEKLTGQPLDHKSIKQKRREKGDELIMNLQPLPGVQECLVAAREHGLKLAIVSCSSREWITSHLKRINLLEFFDYIISREDVKAVKPNPEGYQLALQKLGVSADEAFVVEDSPNGVKAALAAGLRCIVVPNRVTMTLEFPKAYLTLNNLQELVLKTIIEELGPSTVDENQKSKQS